MKDIRSWLQQLVYRISVRFRRFMEGRYGTDRLNMVILCIGLAASLLSSFLRKTPAGLVFWALSYGLMIFAIFRSLSRNTYRRYQENRKFMQLIDRLKDRNNRYFDCPKCHQTVRIPRGKGKVAITCPRCKEKFTKKT